MDMAVQAGRSNTRSTRETVGMPPASPGKPSATGLRPAGSEWIVVERDRAIRAGALDCARGGVGQEPARLEARDLSRR